MAEAQKKCAHPACNCMVSSSSAYCSPYCHDAAGTEEIACNCGHGGCAVEAGESSMTGRPLY